MKERRCTKIACILAASILSLGITVTPVTADAAEPDQVIYDNTNYNFSEYWNTDAAQRTAPVKDGYVFGGWYEDEGTTPLTEKTAAAATTAYAKFVPSYVLSVKAQIEQTAANGTQTTTYIRIATSVDSTKYQSVSFDIWGNNKNHVSNVPEITKVYDSINNGAIVARDAFGAAASKLAVLKLTKIANADSHKIIYVRPNWTTLDGTKVEGLGRYVRVEDGFTANQYISIPVNLLEGKEVAAGIVELSYAAYKDVLEVAKDSNGNYLIDAGRLLPNMQYSVDETNGKIKFVGYTENVDKYNSTESVYASVRFKVKSGATLPDCCVFTMTAGDFTDWREAAPDTLKVTAWDYQYIKGR